MPVHVVLRDVVEVGVVKVGHMGIMGDRRVPAVRAMLMGVIGMMLLGAGRHDVSFLRLKPCRDIWSLFLGSLQATQKGRWLFPEGELIGVDRKWSAHSQNGAIDAKPSPFAAHHA